MSDTTLAALIVDGREDEARELVALRMIACGVPELFVRHTQRFRKVSTRYPRRVGEAYGWDQARAMADSDEEVAERVAAWERAEGIEPRDWQAIGAEERQEV